MEHRCTGREAVAGQEVCENIFLRGTRVEANWGGCAMTRDESSYPRVVILGRVRPHRLDYSSSVRCSSSWVMYFLRAHGFGPGYTRN